VSEDNRIPEEDREERPAAIARAHAALGGPALTTDAELRALTPDQLEKCVHRALEAHDVEAVEGYLLLMALKDPHRAADIVETLKIGVRLAKETRPAPHARPAVADSTDRPAVGVAATHRPATRRRRFRHDDLVAVDLFSGFGGLTRGIEMAGFTTIMAANHNEYKVEVHEANHPDAEHWIADLVDPESADYHSARDLPAATSSSPASPA
jgi:hypothetical protein